MVKSDPKNRPLPLPPVEMRNLVGPTEDELFENPGGELLFPEVPAALYDSVLDFGCGCGRIARMLIQQRHRPQRYVGVDLHRGMIEWCRRSLTPHAPGFEFHHHDTYNMAYNPDGSHEKQSLPVDDASVSLFVAWSVFTHMTQESAEFYLSEVARVLRSDGMALTTWFLFDKGDFPMMHAFQDALFINDVDPTNAAIFDKGWLRTSAGKLGLTLVHIVPPNIRGFQWMVHLKKAEPGVDHVPFPEDLAPRGIKRPPLSPENASSVGLDDEAGAAEPASPPPEVGGEAAEEDRARVPAVAETAGGTTAAPAPKPPSHGRQEPFDTRRQNPATATPSEEAVKALLARGPAVDSPTPFGPWVRWLRRAVLRLIRNYHLHQQELDRKLLEAGRERARVEAEIAREAAEDHVRQIDENLRRGLAEMLSGSRDRIEIALRRQGERIDALEAAADKRMAGTPATREDRRTPASRDEPEPSGSRTPEGGTPPSDREEVEALIQSHPIWYHRIEVAPGILTPGTHASKEVLGHLDELGLPGDGSGMRVLDVGCRDGFFSFEMERRGAEVKSVDYADPDAVGFGIAARLLNSKIEYSVGNVYDLGPEEHGCFDVVLFLGLLYHLRSPMLAVDAIRSVCKPGTRVFVETQLMTDEALREDDRPLWEYFARDALRSDGSNKWAPNFCALEKLFEDCEFKVLERMRNGERGYVTLEAVEDERTGFFRSLDSSVGLWGK